MEKLKLDPLTKVEGIVSLPGSKSLSNRILLLAAAASGDTTITNLLLSDDTKYMLDALKALGVTYVLDEEKRQVKVSGQGAAFLKTVKTPLEIYLGNAGTAMRPLAACLGVVGCGPIALLGEPRMYERPIGPLVDTLTSVGGDISYMDNTGFPPLVIGRTPADAGLWKIDGSLSSQFISALLMAAPLVNERVVIELEGEVVSKPYIDITVDIMNRFGVMVRWIEERKLEVPAGSQYVSPGECLVEGDASSASYFLAAGAIAGGVRVNGVGKASIQGDKAFADVLAKMGALVTWGESYIEVQRNSFPLKALDIDLNHIPDAAMTIAVMAVFCDGTTTIRNIYNWRLKETDRLTAMADELKKIGCHVEEGRDYISITPPEQTNHAEIDTYNDHRMAMCFSLIALSGTAITIKDPGCTSKTFPEYFDVFAQITSS